MLVVHGRGSCNLLALVIAWISYILTTPTIGHRIPEACVTFMLDIGAVFESVYLIYQNLVSTRGPPTRHSQCYIDGLRQYCYNCIANTLALQQSCHSCFLATRTCTKHNLNYGIRRVISLSLNCYSEGGGGGGGQGSNLRTCFAQPSKLVSHSFTRMPKIVKNSKLHY